MTTEHPDDPGRRTRVEQVFAEFLDDRDGALQMLVDYDSGMTREEVLARARERRRGRPGMSESDPEKVKPSASVTRSDEQESGNIALTRDEALVYFLDAREGLDADLSRVLAEARARLTPAQLRRLTRLRVIDEHAGSMTSVFSGPEAITLEQLHSEWPD